MKTHGLHRFYRLMSHLIMASLLIIGADLFASTNLEAKKNGVKVYTDASKKSKVIKKLKKGDGLVAKGRKGMYWELEGGDGFVSVMKVKRKKSSDGGVSNAMRKLVKQGRDAEDPGNSRARSGVMGVRGLDESGDTQLLEMQSQLF